MIAITASEKKIIRKAYPNIPITRTMKQRSKRHHYFLAEEMGPVGLLNSLRGEQKEKGCVTYRRDNGKLS